MSLNRHTHLRDEPTGECAGHGCPNQRWEKQEHESKHNEVEDPHGPILFLGPWVSQEKLVEANGQRTSP
jgi:hypothetical protein